MTFWICKPMLISALMGVKSSIFSSSAIDEGKNHSKTAGQHSMIAHLSYIRGTRWPSVICCVARLRFFFIDCVFFDSQPREVISVPEVEEALQVA